MENSKKRRGRKKKIQLPELDFLESPVENYSSVEHPDFGQPIEFATSVIDGQTQWISPHIKTTFVTPKTKRSAMTRATRCKKARVVLKENQDDNNEIVEQQTSRRVTRSMMDNSVCVTPNSKDNIDEVDSPSVPINLSTPDMRRVSSSTPSSSSSTTHYLFQGETPSTKEFVVLAKDTPF